MALAWLLAAAWVAVYEAAPYFADDWGYISTFRSAHAVGEGIWPPDKAWRWVPFHWLHTNGRAANFMAAFALGFLPKWLVSGVAGAAAAWMSVMVLRLGGVWRRRGRVALCCVAMAAVVLLFPWWNYLFSIDVNFNYALSSAVLLSFVWLLWRGVRVTPWLLCPLGFLAGAMHEAASLPVAAAMMWLWWRGDGCRPGRAARGALWAFAAGCVLVASSPGVWGRLGASPGGADHPLPLQLLYSAPLAFVAAAVVAAAMCGGRGRRWMASVMADRMWSGAAVACVVALVFCAVSGVTGRSGWFAQLYALVALLRMGALSGVRLRRGAAAEATAAASLTALVAVVAPVGGLHASAGDVEAIGRLLSSYGSGKHPILYRDLCDEHRQPLWRLGRVRALEDADAFTLKQIAEYYGKESLTVLPSAMSRVPLDSVASALSAGSSYPLPDGSVLVSSLPPMRDFRMEGEAYLYLPALPGAVCYDRPVMCIPVRTQAGRTLYRLVSPRYFFGEHPLL